MALTDSNAALNAASATTPIRGHALDFLAMHSPLDIPTVLVPQRAQLHYVHGAKGVQVSGLEYEQEASLPARCCANASQWNFSKKNFHLLIIGDADWTMHDR
jgi:hypothetical protein